MSSLSRRMVFRTASKEEINAIENALPKLEYQPYKQTAGVRKETNSGKETKEAQSKNAEVETTQTKRSKFHLERIHRLRVEEELGLIRESLQDYSESSEIRERKRRTENIYILTSLGIIGGYISYNPNLVVRNLFQIVTLGFALASAVFLFIKVSIVNQSRIGRETFWTKLDNLADKAFPGLIAGVLVLGTGSIVTQTYQIQSTELLQIIFTAFALVTTALTMYQQFTSHISIEESPVSFRDIEKKLFELPANKPEKQKKNINDYLDLLEEYSESRSRTSNLEQIKSKVGVIKGLSDEEVDEITEKIDELIEEMEKRQMSEEEIRQERLDELDEQRKSYLDDLENNW